MTKQNLGDIVWLNLDEVTLSGFEHMKYTDKIAKYVRAIESGADFPPVFVTKLEEGKYVLSGYWARDSAGVLIKDRFGEYNYGGHHRSLAHYIAGKPLKCQITKFIWDEICDVNIKDIILDKR